MKLKKLTINNIASIQQAEIDFDSAPLSDERLFLITGETGSGKSTIIDCLCLALYGKTPRLKDAKGTKYANKHDDEDAGTDEFEINDTRQLMRRGSVSASVVLTFDDDNGRPFTAEWEVHRAHNKASGAIQSVTRSLYTDEGVTPAEHLKGKHINPFITELTGLDENQFLRTVVLAQGKFAEFLNSDENTKSTLLEKMTGTSIYTQVSQKIYKVTQEKSNRCTILLGQMENITLLNDEQKAQINDEATRLANESKVVKEQHDKAAAMAKWLTDKKGIENALAEKEKQLADDLTQTSSQSHQEQQRLVKEWDDSAQARRHHDELRQADKQIKTLQEQQPATQEEYDQLCAALRAAATEIERMRQQVTELDEAIKQEEPNKAMYEAMGQITTLAGQWLKGQKNITDYTSDLEKDKGKLPQAEENLKTAEATVKQREDDAKTLQQQYESLSITDISNRKDALSKACRALETLLDKHRAVNQAQTALDDLKKQQAEDTDKLQRLKATIDGKRALRDKAQQDVERLTGWNELLIQAQNTLHKGDTCPVCGNTISQMLVPKAESELEELRQQFRLADEDLRQTDTDIKAAEVGIANNGQLILKAEKDLTKKQDDRETNWQVTQEALASCGEQVGQMTGTEETDALIQKLEQQAQQLNTQIEKASELARQVQEAQKQLTTASQVRHKAEMALNTLKDSIKYQAQLIEDSKQEMETVAQRLNGLLVMNDWKERATTDEGFITRLQAQAGEYQQTVNRRQQLSQHIELRSAAIPAMRQSRDNIQGLTDHGIVTETVPDDLDTRWHNLENRHLQWQTQLNSAQDTADKSKRALDDILQAKPGITLARLDELSLHTQTEIDAIRKAHQTLAEGITSTRGAIEALSKQRADIITRKPDFNEENPERLEAFIDQQDGRLNTLTARIAELKNLLSTDEANIKLLGNKKEELDRAQIERDHWEKLNDMLGSASGTKFRNIAQSYILGELLASANGYLRQFNNRYELEANPGSLTILARDLIQGDLTAVNTLSGGESFMVALALALALSNMTGKIFSVDTLFIDEGFGSLSPGYLDNVMETLNRLYELGGRRVGIISHVETLKERVATQIKVTRDPDNNTVSRVTVV